jgi:hypothetical protein
VTGDAGGRGRVLAHPSVPPVALVVAVEEFDAPNVLTLEERHVWLELAPHAFKAGTLTAASALAFVLLCQNVIRERKYGASLTDCGGSSHRGLIQRVEGGLEAFDLRPRGKPMTAPAVAQPEPKAASYWV